MPASPNYPRDWSATAARPSRAGPTAPGRRPVRPELRGRRRELRSCMAMPPPRPSCRRSRGAALPGLRHMNVELIYEYGSRAGFWRLLRLFGERGCRSPSSASPGAGAQSGCRRGDGEAGREIATHGLRWIDYKDFTRRRSARTWQAIGIQTEADRRASAWLVPGPLSPNTPAAGAGGRRLPLFDADSYADDLPYWDDGPNGPHLIVPYTLDANDMRFITPQGFDPARSSSPICCDALRRALCRRRTCAEDDVGWPALPARREARPAAALRGSSNTSSKHDRVWVATRLDIARHWRARACQPDAVGARGRHWRRAWKAEALREPGEQCSDGLPTKAPRERRLSGRRDSNPRPRPWQGRALPLSYTRIRWVWRQGRQSREPFL